MVDSNVKSFIENVNALANASSLATGDIVEDTQTARDEAVRASEKALESELNAKDSENLAHEWSSKGHNNPITGTAGIDAEFSSYHWSVESSINSEAGRLAVINDALVSTTYTWSSQKITDQLADKSNITHRHDGIYEPVINKNSAFNKSFSTPSGVNGSSGVVARADHLHTGDYEPKIQVYGTAFNKDFGTTSGTVMEGDKNFDSDYMPITTINTAYNKNFVVDSVNPLADEVPRGTHGHPASKINYDNSNTGISSSTTQGAITELSGRVSSINVAEATYITALSQTQYTQPIVAQNTPTKVLMPMPLIQGNKNATNNSNAEFKIKYPDNVRPDKLVEGTYTVTVVLSNTENFAINLAVDGVLKGEAVRGSKTLTITQFITGLNISGVNTAPTEATLSFMLTNLDSAADAIIESANAVWHGKPAGSLVVSGSTIDHSDLTGTGAANGVHTISDIQGLQTELDTKAESINPTTDKIAKFDSNGNLVDSSIDETTVTGKMDKIASPTLDNIVVMDTAGNSKKGSLKIGDLALKNGTTTEIFKVASSVNDTDAVNQGQMNGLASTYTLKTTFDTHEAASNPHNTTYADVGAAPLVHTHVENDIAGLADSLASKYDKVPSAVTGNTPIFGAGDVLLDSGYPVINPGKFETVDKAAIKNELQNDAVFSGYGNTERVDNTDRFKETDTPNLILDTVGDSVRLTDGLVDTLGDELVTNGDFSNGTTGWSTGRGAILSVRDEKIYIKNSSLASGYTTQMIPTQAGKTYTCSVQMLTSNDGTPFGITVNSTDTYIGDLYNMYNGTLRKEYETLEFTFTAINTTSYLVLIIHGGYTNSTEQSYDNISVKELPQAELPLAPFAQGSTDELLDDKVNGVTTQTNHAKGDIVVSGNELNENTYTLRVLSDELVLTGDSYKVISNTVGDWSGAAIERLFPFIPEQEYTVSLDVDFSNAGTLTKGFAINATDGLNLNNNSINIFSTFDNSVTHISAVFKATTYTKAIYMQDYTCGNVGEYVVVSNISVTAVDDMHQAITDTAAGDLVTDTSKFQVIDAVTRYDVIAYSKSGYKTYKGIGSYDESMSADDIATAQGWSKLDNGLYSDGVDEISSLRVVQRLNAGAYHPAFNNHGCSLSHDPSSTGIQTWYRSNITSTFEACTERAIADSSVVGYVPNTGMIGFVDNPSYTRRPDVKFYDKIYNEGVGGIVGVGTYTTDDINLDIESTKLLGDSGLERGVECYGSPHGQINGDLNPSTTMSLDWGVGIPLSNGDIIYSENPDGSYGYGVVQVGMSVYQKSPAGPVTITQNNTVVASGITEISNPNGSLIGRKLNGTILVVGKTNYKLTQNSSLSVDVIGDPSQYLSTDATYTVPTTVSITDMPVGTLVWDESTGKMYKSLLATNDIDANGVPVPAFTDTASWGLVQKGYPQDWLNRLASGKSLPFNPLLVGENGEDYLDGRQTYKIISKGVQELDSQFMDISSFVWASTTKPFDPITNTYSSLSDALTRIWLCNTISRNKPLYKSTPLPIEQVSHKAIVSNSHSIYKSAMVTNVITDKVSVGNGSNGLESKVLENAELGAYDDGYDGIINDDGDLFSGRIAYLPSRNNEVWCYTVTELVNWTAAMSSIVEPSWELIGHIGVFTTPQHNTIVLDAEVSPASKYFTMICIDTTNNEKCLAVSGEEMVSNAGAYDGTTNTFQQLTNGTIIDLNGVTVKTTVAMKRLGVFKGDR